MLFEILYGLAMLFVKLSLFAHSVLPFLLAAVAISQWRLASRVAGLQGTILSQQGVAGQGTGAMTVGAAPDDADALPGQDRVNRDTGKTVPLPPQPAAGGKVPSKEPFLRKLRRNWMSVAAVLLAIIFWPFSFLFLWLIQERLVSQVDGIQQALAPEKDRTIAA